LPERGRGGDALPVGCGALPLTASKSDDAKEKEGRSEV